MDSRSKILNALQKQERGSKHAFEQVRTRIDDPLKRFREVLTSIGGQVVELASIEEVRAYIKSNYRDEMRVYTPLENLGITRGNGGYRFQDIELVVLNGRFGVAENGAVWITDTEMPDRALPFITQHLMLIVARKNILATMAEAYEEIGSADYEFGIFVAGPSKTADIEQSLVLGAHGPKTMTVILLG